MTESVAETPPSRPGLRKWLIWGGVVVLLGIAVLWFVNRNRESTDDAFIESNVVEISPHIGGYAIRVLVEDNQPVKAGDPLVEIDPRDYQLKVDQAVASLAAAQARHGAEQQDLAVVTTTVDAVVLESSHALAAARASADQARAQARATQAQADLARQDLQRYQSLFDKDEISRQRLDQARTAATAAEAQRDAGDSALQQASARVLEAEARLKQAHSAPQQVALKQAQALNAKASVAEAEAALAQARLDLSYTRVVAPVAGRVTHKSLLVGQLLQAGTPILALVSGPPWVVANFKETQLREMRVGAPVDIRVDAVSGSTFKGHVDSFQAGTGARFSLLPPENASGNYVKVVQRVPIKILFDEPEERLRRLAPGLSVVPTVHLDSP